MEPLTLLLRLPLLPVQAVIRLGEIVAEEAERELHDPARVRRELEDAQQRSEAGEITDEELASTQEQATRSLVSDDTPASERGGDHRS